jgi:hypothetical protein
MIILLFITLVFLILTGIVFNFLPQRSLARRSIFWFSSLILILLAGFREVGIDPDSIGYKKYYESDLILFLAEPTFAFISFIVRNVFNNFQFVLVLYAIIGILIKYKAINRLTDLKFLSVIVYFGTYYLLHDFTQIRAAVASGILLLCIEPLVKRKFWHFLFLVILAFFFHYSSIVLLPLWFLDNKQFSKKKKFLLYISIPIGVLFYLLKLDIIVMIPIETIKYKIEIYKATQESADVTLNVFNLVYVVKYLIFYVLLFFYDLLYLKAKYVSILLQIYALSLFAYLALSQNTIFAMRISELLGIVEILLIPFLYYLIKERVVGYILVITIASIYLYINIYYIILVQVIN